MKAKFLVRTGIKAGMTNPASTHCEQVGGQSTILNIPSCGDVGLCSFPNGTICEEWALMNGDCSPFPLFDSGLLQ